jgi:hypothetical protein
MRRRSSDASELPPHWEKVQSAIWLIGLAILFWRDWIFPGILVLVAVSALTQAALTVYLNRQAAMQDEQAAKQAQQDTRQRHLPEHCPNCGGPISPAAVQWRGPLTAVCPFCASAIKATPQVEAVKPPAM